MNWLLLHSCSSVHQGTSILSLVQVDNGQILGFSADLSEVWGRVFLALCWICAVLVAAGIILPPPTALACAQPVQDHPGFHDAVYKQRRVDICNLARTHQM